MAGTAVVGMAVKIAEGFRGPGRSGDDYGQDQESCQCDSQDPLPVLPVHRVFSAFVSAVMQVSGPAQISGKSQETAGQFEIRVYYIIFFQGIQQTMRCSELISEQTCGCFHHQRKRILKTNQSLLFNIYNN